MTFSVFRKYQTPLLIAAVFFTVVVFVFFPSFGSVSEAFQGGDPNDRVFGRFRLQGAGDTVEVSRREFGRTYQSMERFYLRYNDLEDAEVWMHIMLAADARKAGLFVPDADLVRFFQDNGLVAAADYERLWRDRKFASAKAFEEFVKELLLVGQWSDVLSRQSGIVTADEVYLSWRVNNEVFDMEAVVFADVEAESIDDPGDEVLQAYFDETPEYLRTRRFSDPAKYEVAYAWLPLGTPAAELPAERLAELGEITDASVDLRFAQLKSGRFPDMEAIDDATRALLHGELVVMGLVAQANTTWVAEQLASTAGDETDGVDNETQSDASDASGIAGAKRAFVNHMASYGLLTADPEGLLGPEGLTDLPDIGSALLSAQLTSVESGDSRYFRPFGDDTDAHVVFVEDSVASVPLEYPEARGLVLTQWRREPDQVGAAAYVFREGLTNAARDLPEAQDLITPLTEMAAMAAEARITQTDLDSPDEPIDEAARQVIRDEELASVETAIEARLAEFASRFWEQHKEAARLADEQNVAMVSVSDVPKNYRRQLDEEEDSDSVERFLKINSRIFQQDVDGVTDVLRHAVGGNSVVARVTGRRFPPKADMLSDAEGMEQSRGGLSQMNLFTFRSALTPEKLSAPYSESNPFGHDLQRIEVVDPEADEDSEEVEP